MSRLTKLLLLLLLAAFPADANITLVQHTPKDAGTVTSTTLAYSSNPSANNLLVVCTRTGGTTATITITDSIGNTWTNLTRQSVTGVGVTQCAWAINTTSSADTITDTLSTSTTLRMVILEASGTATSTPVDQETNAGTSTGVTANSATMTISNPNELILAFFAEGGTTISCSAGTNFTLQDAVPSSSDCKLAVETWIQTTATNTGGPLSYGLSTQWMAGLIAFKPAGGAPASTTFPQVVKGESNEKVTWPSIRFNGPASLGSGPDIEYSELPGGDASGCPSDYAAACPGVWLRRRGCDDHYQWL